jgi:FlaA1/EpsC-like NDP-sugar epimerase
VLVTGAGGSIGSELCRQIARSAPRGSCSSTRARRRSSRSSASSSTSASFPRASGARDCGDRAKMRQVFERYRPSVVFHAAAYKHVPLMEANPLEAVTNNVLATRALVEVAVESGVARFVLISTDKAANPKNIMGQSKAVCEWIVESFARRSDVATRFVAVRFGNVLASSAR